MNYIGFGLEVKKIRKQCKLSREAVSKLSGLSVETIRRIEVGIPEPKLSSLEQLSHIYKVDLIGLLTNYYDLYSFYNDQWLNCIFQSMRDVDYNELNVYVNDLLNQIATENISKKPSVQHFKIFLNTLKGMKANDSSYLNSNLVHLEQTYFALSRSVSGIKKNIAYAYRIEVTIGIYLAILYRRNNECQKAIKLLEELLLKVKIYPFDYLEKHDQIGAIYLNISYTYHILDDHDKVLTVISELLSDQSLCFNRILYHDLLLRKAIALFHLKNDDYKVILDFVFMHESPSRIRAIQTVFKEKYGI